ncbi:MAG: hypothetical protein J0M02_01330 [Planctomycetes bacterium]|nr:hypothetical protein [Planctomycetota bacterium]
MHIETNRTSKSSPHSSDRLCQVLLALSLLAADQLAKAEQAKLDKAESEHILAQFDRLKAIIRQLLFDWDIAKAVTVEEFRSPSLENVVVRIRCQITAMDPPVLVDGAQESTCDIIAMLGNQPRETAASTTRALRTSFRIMGESGVIEDVLPITDRQLIEMVAAKRLTCPRFEVMAVVVTVSEVVVQHHRSEVVSHFRLLPIDVRPLTKAIQLVGPSPGELQMVTELMTSCPAPLAYIMRFLVGFLRIQNLDALPILREALEMQILSAVSEVRRLHMALIGPPGVGKSLVTKAAKLVQPVAYEALPTRVTEAGLIGIGSGSTRKDARRAGLIPMADQGVFIVQDWHQANGVKNQRLCAVLATTMQDGMVHDSSASRCSYQAETAILIDANRKSDVERTARRGDQSGIDQLIRDVKVPLNLLTRFAFIAEIPRDIEAQIRTFGDILDSAGEQYTEPSHDLLVQARIIKVWLARLRDLHPTVRIPKDVAEHLRAATEKAINITHRRLQENADYGDFMVRLSEQAVSLVQAHARLHHRDEAVLADVDGIYPYIHRKMMFLKGVLFGADTAAADVDAGSPGRRLLMRLRLKPGFHTAASVRRLLCLTSCSEETIAADLAAMYGAANDAGAFTVG